MASLEKRVDEYADVEQQRMGLMVSVLISVRRSRWTQQICVMFTGV